jgi:hypothetical protein
MIFMNMSRICVYTEDVPAKKDVVVRGMSRAGTPLLRSILEYVDRIVLYQKHGWLEKEDIDPELLPVCSFVPRWAVLLSKMLRRTGFLRTADRLSSYASVRALRGSSAGTIFAYIGTDYGVMSRVARIARQSGKQYALFVVDDFVAPLRIAGASDSVIELVREEAGNALRGARHVFTITDGLGAYLRENFGVSPTTLRLVFEPAPRPVVPVKRQIIYVGSINFLYVPGLRDLFQAVERVRLASGEDLKVRLTVSARIALRELGELPPFVIATPADSADELAGEIASSLFAYLPYSFDPREKAMVSTSFPSKSLEYLAYARSIVVYGPEYGVATKLFEQMDLPRVVSTRESLEAAVALHLADSPEHSVQYQEYLAEAHSLVAACQTIRHNLELGEL